MTTTTKVEFLIHAPIKEDALFAAAQIWEALAWKPRNPASVRAVTPGIWSAVATIPASTDEVRREARALTMAIQASGRPTDIGAIRPVRRR